MWNFSYGILLQKHVNLQQQQQSLGIYGVVFTIQVLYTNMIISKDSMVAEFRWINWGKQDPNLTHPEKHNNIGFLFPHFFPSLRIQFFKAELAALTLCNLLLREWTVVVLSCNLKMPVLLATGFKNVYCIGKGWNPFAMMLISLDGVWGQSTTCASTWVKVSNELALTRGICLVSRMKATWGKSNR